MISDCKLLVVESQNKNQLQTSVYNQTDTDSTQTSNTQLATSNTQTATHKQQHNTTSNTTQHNEQQTTTITTDHTTHAQHKSYPGSSHYFDVEQYILRSACLYPPAKKSSVFVSSRFSHFEIASLFILAKDRLYEYQIV